MVSREMPSRCAAWLLLPWLSRRASSTAQASSPSSLRWVGTAAAAGPARGMDFVGQMPFGRLPTPQDYVAPMVFLASDDSALMTGSNLTIDGGATAKYWPQSPARRA